MLTLMAAAHPPNREQSRIGLVSYLAGMGKAPRYDIRAQRLMNIHTGTNLCLLLISMRI